MTPTKTLCRPTPTPTTPPTPHPHPPPLLHIYILNVRSLHLLFAKNDFELKQSYIVRPK